MSEVSNFLNRVLFPHSVIFSDLILENLGCAVCYPESCLQIKTYRRNRLEDPNFAFEDFK
ncbi:MAG: hypothetical protein OHK0019_38100 [Saprospiraceae bacterium]